VFEPEPKVRTIESDAELAKDFVPYHPVETGKFVFLFATRGKARGGTLDPAPGDIEVIEPPTPIDLIRSAVGCRSSR
jgi:hypothetical protein